MRIADLIKAAEDSLGAAMKERASVVSQQHALLDTVSAEGRSNLSPEEDEKFTKLSERKREIDADVSARQTKVDDLRAEQAKDDEYEKRSGDITRTEPSPDQRVKVTSEPRTYSAEKDRTGRDFLLDVARGNLMNDYQARDRLQQHMVEERVERGDKLERAIDTSAVSGLVLPQYLVELYAPHAKALRPFADICNRHDLPASGMNVTIGKLTTGTDTGLQATEGAAVAEQNADDTLISPAVQTNAGQQTLSKQAVMRGVGVDDVLMQDLFRAYNTRLDNTLITQATTGLSAVAPAVAYTDATPTAAELWPKFLDASSRVEAGLLGYGQAKVAVMHSRRWYWLQSQVGTSWPFMSQPGIPVQAGGVNTGEQYGAGFRGVLPSGLAVVVDNNIATNLGAGTNEDEAYVVDNDECHLWEDPSAPYFIDTEEVKAANLQVLFVIYGFFAYTFTRFNAATAKIGGTGLIAPTF